MIEWKEVDNVEDLKSLKFPFLCKYLNQISFGYYDEDCLCIVSCTGADSHMTIIDRWVTHYVPLEEEFRSSGTQERQ